MSANNTKDSSNKNRSILSILSIVFGIIGLLFSCILIGFIPAVAGLIVGIIALTKKDKRAIWGIVCSAIGLIIAGSVFAWALTVVIKQEKVEKLINNGEYESAMELIDSYDFSEDVERKFYYDIYVGQGNYDEAFQVIYSEIESDYDNIDSVSDENIEKLKSIYENVSAENKEKFDQFEKDRDALIKAKAEQEAKEKAEKEAKEKAEKEAIEKAKAEKEAKEKAELEAKEKAEAEAKAKAEQEAAEQAKKKAQEETDRKDKEQYGITLDEFIEILNSYSDPPSEIESEEVLREYYQNEFNTWKDDPKHFGWKQDANGEWYYEQPIEKYEIEDMAVNVTVKDLIRYEEDYLNEYVVMVVRIESGPNTGEYICDDTTYYNYGDVEGYLTADETLIIKDERYYDDIKWLEGDYIRIYGKFLGVETRTLTYRLTGNETEFNLPIFEVYYGDLVQE